MDQYSVKFYETKNCKTTRFVSGRAVYEERLDEGFYYGMYWSAANQVHRENVLNGLPEDMNPIGYPVNSFELEIDGQSLHNHWEFERSYEEKGENTTTAYTVLKNKIKPVTLKICTKLDGTSILVRWLEIENTSDKAFAISAISPFCGVLWKADTYQGRYGWPILKNPREESMYSVGYYDACAWGEEGNFKWVDIKQETFKITKNARRHFGNPYYIARNNATGESFFIGLAWSGGFETEFYYNRIGNIFSFRTAPKGKAPLRVVAAGETVTSPAVHIGPMHCDVDTAVSAWYEHLRTSVIPKRPDDKKMYVVAGRVVEEPNEWILKEIDIAADMGCEAFMVDAGWFGDVLQNWGGNRGDWYVGDWMPGGIDGVREYTHKKGMLFGLWMEPEAICSLSQTFKNHPEWKVSYNETNKRFYTNEEEINFGIPEAAEYVKSSIKKVIKDFKLDFFKIDYNSHTYEGVQNMIEGYAENDTWRHYETIYSTFEEIHEECPNVMLENCASGGGRNDLGMVSRLHYSCESDYSIFPFSIRALNGLTLFIPPESLVYYHNHLQPANLMTDIDTHLRVLLFCIPIFVGFGAQDADFSSAFFVKTREYVELHKGFCRGVLENAPVVYHHTPYIGVYDDADYCVLEYGAKDKSKGYCGVFKLFSNKMDTYNLRLKGVDSSKNYKVTLHNSNDLFIVSGFELKNKGLNIDLEATHTSELVLFEAVE